MATTITAFFDRYRRAFEAYDLDALTALVHLPCLIAAGGDLVAVGQAEDLRRRLARQFDRHREIGVHDARFDVLDHRRLDARLVSADVHWVFVREDGETLVEFGVNYTLTAPESGWKIACVLPLDLSPPT
ncbi:MAG: hypothetical protein AAF721_25035 [Myxococcota bacterium]